MVKKLIFSLILILFISSCSNQKEYEWSHGDYLHTPFSTSVPDEVVEMFNEIRERLKDLPESDNRICVDWCTYFKTSEINGYIIKTYRHVQANAPEVCEIYFYENNEYKLIERSEDLRFYVGICDGEYLYYTVSDGSLRRIDSVGDIKIYDVFEEENIGELLLEADKNIITVISLVNENRSISFDINSFLY